jgi:hypothetical protein
VGRLRNDCRLAARPLVAAFVAALLILLRPSLAAAAPVLGDDDDLIVIGIPTVTLSLTSPPANNVYTAPASIQMQATAKVAAGSISNINVYQAGTLLGSGTTPFNFTWSGTPPASGVPAGVYSLTARATTSLGLIGTSPSVTLRVCDVPTVALTAPTAGALVSLNSSVTLQASASSPANACTINRVEFYAQSTLVGTAYGSPPYQMSWTATPLGSVSLTAKAYDEREVSGTSAAVSVTVGTAPAITSANNATLTVSQAGSFTFTASGSPAPTFALSGCSLPSGVSLNAVTGVLSGTPGAATGGTYACTLTAQNGVGSPATQSFTLAVNQAPAITSTNNATFSVGQNGSFTFTASGYPASSFSLSGCTLPTGVSLNGSSGVLSCVPASGTDATYNCTLSAQNGVGSPATQGFTLTVNPAPAIDARAKGLAWLFQHQRGDGSWAGAAGLEVQATSAALNAFMNAGIRQGNNFNAGVAKLVNSQPASTDGKARQVATLRQVGNDVTSFVALLQAAGNQNIAWGSLPGYGSSPGDTALALSALLDAVSGYSTTNAQTALCAAILPTQRTGGGWSYQGLGTNTPPTAANASIVPTAYTILLLQKTINVLGLSQITCGTTYTLSTVINNAITFLLTKQSASDHGFGEDGTSGALETALAYLAIQYVNPSHSALGPAQGYLVSSQLANGSWANDPFQTALALQTFPSTTLTQSANDGVPDVVKQVLGISGTAAVRNLLPGNGLGVVGTTAPSVVAIAVVNQVFSYTLTGTGGVAPYTFSLVSGNLPDGLTLAANGTISGTPTVAGPFSFIYQAKDSQNAIWLVNAQILVN